MNKKLLKLPVLTLIGGIILQIADYITAFTLVKGTSEWTLEMGTTAFYIRLVLSIIFFVVIGIILRRIYDRKTLVKIRNAVSDLFNRNISVGANHAISRYI